MQKTIDKVPRKGTETDTYIEDILESMTLEEKISMIHATTKFTNSGVKRFNIPPLTMSDGPHGVREEISKDSWEPAGWENDTCTYLPVGTAQAATFNPKLLKKAGEVLGAESREREKDIILGPGFNMLRSPLCGRIFEYYSEDPWLNAVYGIEAVQGIQSMDTGACIKHFALNNQELNRNNNNVVVDDKTLHEIYLYAFEQVVKKTDIASVMGSYNKYKGIHACQNKTLLQEILKNKWGFAGFVVTDWNAINDTGLAALSGLDLEMGTEVPNYDDYYFAKNYQKGLETGQYPMTSLNDKVRRLLKVMFQIGVFDPKRKIGERNSKKHQQIALEIARESLVLLKNDKQGLPINPRSGEKVLLLGENAVMLHASGGNSSGLKAEYEISPFEGFRRALPSEVDLIHEPAYPHSFSGISVIPTTEMSTVDQGSGVKGWKASYFGNRDFQGPPLKTAFVESVAWDQSNNRLPEGIPSTMFSIIWEGEFNPLESGDYDLGVYYEGSAYIEVNGEILLDHLYSASTHKEVHSYKFEKGKNYAIKVMYSYGDSSQRFEFGYIPPYSQAQEEDRFGRAIKAAKEADHLIFIGGLNHQFDLECRDRSDLELPYDQNPLIEALLELRPDMIVTILSGSPVTFPWLSKCENLIWMSYAGMESGTALAEIILGKTNPSGHLPFSFPKSLEKTGPHSLGSYAEDESIYSEKDMLGYRYHLAKKTAPFFFFGEGLSYGSLSIGDCETRELKDEVRIQFTVKGSQVDVFPLKKAVQVYVTTPDKSYPVLKGVKKVELKSAATEEGSIMVKKEDLMVYENDIQAYALKKGTYQFYLGLSAKDLHLVGEHKL